MPTRPLNNGMLARNDTPAPHRKTTSPAIVARMRSSGISAPSGRNLMGPLQPREPRLLVPAGHEAVLSTLDWRQPIHKTRAYKSDVYSGGKKRNCDVQTCAKIEGCWSDMASDSKVANWPIFVDYLLTIYAKTRICLFYKWLNWWAHLGLNQGPLACEASALPLSYAPFTDWVTSFRTAPIVCQGSAWSLEFSIRHLRSPLAIRRREVAH